MTPGTFAVARLLAATSLRRWWNRYSAFARKRKGQRDATARKGGRSLVMLALLGSLFLVQAFMLSYQFSLTVARAVESRDGRIPPVETHPGTDAAPDDENPAIGLGDPADSVHRYPRFGDRAWVRTAPADAVVRCFAVLLSVLTLALLFVGLGTGNNELSQVGWSMEWLFGFPVPTRALLLAKAGEYALTAIFAWFTLFPISTTMLWNAGWGAWGLLGGLGLTLMVAGGIASVRVLVETTLRKRFALHGIKNVQAGCTLIGMLLMFGVFALVIRGTDAELLLVAGDAVGDALLLGPVGSAAGVVQHPAYALLFVAWILGVVGLCLRGAEALVASGLVSEGGPYQGTRRTVRASRRIGGILSKDLRLLARDRNLLMQTLVIPLVIVGFQFVVNPLLASASHPRSVAVLAYGIAAYVVAFGGLRILVAEQNALWLLFSLPTRLDRLLRRKTIIWGVAASGYAVAVLAYAWRPSASMGMVDWMAPVLALAGVFFCAFLAGAIGTIGFDPFQTELSRKIPPELSLLYMAIAAIYGYGVAVADLWGQLRFAVLTLFLVLALWDRVRRRVPYLLDPTAVPPRRIEIGDGLIAAFVFAFVQVLVGAIAAAQGARASFAIALAYGVAGLVTLLLSLYGLWRARVRLLLPRVGIRPVRPGAILAGLATGLVVAAAALGYLHVMRQVPIYRHALDAAAGLDSTSRILLTVVAVGMAPVFEEFLFRGLLFRGLIRTMRLPSAVIASALVFAIIHPAPSFPTVLLLGVATALLFHRTKALWAPIAAHAAYNAVVTFAQFS